MAPRQRASRLTVRGRGLLVTASAAAVAAGLSAGQRLIRQRSAERRIGERPGSGDGAAKDGGLEPVSPGSDQPERALTQAGRRRPDGRPPGIGEIYRQGRRALARIEADQGPEPWQELSQRSLDLWRATQTLQAANPERIRKLGQRAQRLSQLLGDDHDLGVLDERMGRNPSDLRPDEVELIHQLIGRRRRKLRRRAQRTGRRLYRRKPAKFRRRLGLR